MNNDVRMFRPLLVLYIVRLSANISLCATHPEKGLFLYWMLPDEWKMDLSHALYLGVYIMYAGTMWTNLVFTITSLFLYLETAKAATEYR